MIDATRRGFLKLGTAIVGGIALIKYAEPVIKVDDDPHEWIEDKGDFVIVRVPDFKTFANEVIRKPAIFILGERALLQGVDVGGFVNVYAPRGGVVKESCFDASRMEVEKKRPVMNLKGQDIIVNECRFIGGGWQTSMVTSVPGLKW